MLPNRTRGNSRVSFSVPQERPAGTNGASANTHSNGDVARGPSPSNNGLMYNGAYVQGVPSPSSALARRNSGPAVSQSRARVPTSRRQSLSGSTGHASASMGRANLPPARTSGLFWADPAATAAAAAAAYAQATTTGAGAGLAVPTAPRPEMGATPAQLVVRPTLHEKTVLLVGIVDNPDVLRDIAEVLRFAQQQCGLVRGAFRFPRSPPPGIERPTYSSAVLLVVFDKSEDAARAVQLFAGHIFSNGMQVRACPATELALHANAAEKCLQSFVPYPSRSDVMASDTTRRAWSCSDRLWTVILSSQSPYEPDWDAARRAAERCEAVVVMESTVYLSCGAPDRDGTGTGRRGDSRTRAGAKRGRSERDEAAAGREATAPIAGSRGHETVQQMFYDQKYGKRDYHVGDTGSFLTRSVKQFMRFFAGGDGGSGHAEAFGESEYATPTAGATPEPDHALSPASRGRRLEDGATGPGATRRLNWLGEAMSWLPGLPHAAPFLRRDTTPHKDRVKPARYMDEPTLAGRDAWAEPDAHPWLSAHAGPSHYAFIPESLDPAEAPARAVEQLLPLDERALHRRFESSARGAASGLGVSLGGHGVGSARPAKGLAPLRAAPTAHDARAGGRAARPPHTETAAMVVGGRSRAAERLTASAPPAELSRRAHDDGAGGLRLDHEPPMKALTMGPPPIQLPGSRPREKVYAHAAPAPTLATPMRMPAPLSRPALTPFGVSRGPASDTSNTGPNSPRITVLSINRSGDAPQDMNLSAIGARSVVSSVPSERRPMRALSSVGFTDL